jgi:hypothetical protein
MEIKDLANKLVRIMWETNLSSAIACLVKDYPEIDSDTLGDVVMAAKMKVLEHG